MKIINRKMERKDLITATTNVCEKLKINNFEKFNMLRELTQRDIKSHDDVTLEEWQQFLIQLSLNLYKSTIPTE